MNNLSQEAKILIAIAAVSIAILGGAVFFLSRSPAKDQAPGAVVEDSKLIKQDSNKTGSDSAKIKIVEFGDFQCPACKVAFPVIEKVREDYKKDLQFVFRHFPLPQHQYGFLSAKAAEAAGEQGKFWEYYAKLYENQDTWSDSKNPKEDFISYAKDLGLDVEKFTQTLDSTKFEDKINADRSEGNSLGVNSTPTFYINGQKLEGNFSYQNFQSKIDPLLK